MTPRPADLITRLQGHLGSTDLRGSIPVQPIKVSIVVAVYNPPINALRIQLDAIAEQSSQDWECIIVNDGSTSLRVAEILRTWAAVDGRRKVIDRPVNGGIAAATNDGLDRASGDVVMICDHDDILDGDAVKVVIEHFNKYPKDDVVYSDEQLINDAGQTIHPYCKPDFSPYRFLGHHYFAHVTAARRAAIGDTRIRAEYEPTQDYDFYLRVVEGVTARGRQVGHIRRSLYSWRAIAGSVALDPSEKPGMSAAVARCVRSAFDRRGIDAEVIPVELDGKPTPSVQHRFPSSDASTTFIEIDDRTTSADVARVIESSTTSVMCLVPRQSLDLAWTQPLIDLVVQPDVGAVGPRILTPDGSLLSIGRDVAPVLQDPFRGHSGSATGPWAAFVVTREVSALAPVGLVLDREAVLSVGGLASDIGLDAAVAELCALLRGAGKATLATPTSELVCDERFVPDPTVDPSVDDDMSVVQSRVATVRDERYAPTGTAPLVDWEPPASTQLRRLVAGGQVDLVTSDVFDTIVDRPVATPSDIFIRVGQRLRDGGVLAPSVTPELFAAGRIYAERIARTRLADLERSRNDSLPEEEVEVLPGVASPECTLAQIWAEMPQHWTVDISVEDLIQVEMDVESTYLRPITPMIEVLAFAVERSVPVQLVSDIYLSSAQLSSVLRAAGVNERILTHITTSADHEMGKAAGLLKMVINKRGVAPTRTVHVGDNPEADVATALSIGAIAVAADVSPTDRQVPMPAASLAGLSAKLGSDGGICAASRSTLVAAGSLSLDPSFQFGAAIAGPAMAGFARWIAVTAAGLGTSHVHCLLREGATIAELMTATAPDGPTPSLVHASRWVNMRAAVIDGTPDELMTALARRASLTPQHVTDAFGVDSDVVTRVLGASEIPHSRLRQACQRLAANDALRQQIVASSAELRSRTMPYLLEHLIIDDGPIVFADVGWGGTIQEGLVRLLRAEGIDNEVIGLYFAMSAPGEDRARGGAQMMTYLPNALVDPAGSRSSRVVAHNAEIIERILTPQLGTLIDFEGDGTPVCRPDDADYIPPTLRSAQRAMRETVTRLADQPGGLPDRFFVDDFSVRRSLGEMIAEVIESPTPLLATALGSWPHDDVAGTSHRSIDGDGLDTAIKFANAHDCDLIDWSESGWIGAVAARRNPSFGAQLAATNNGIASSALCATSENGVSSLAAFPIDSKLAALLDERPVRTGANGWSLARVRGPVDSLRAIQFRAGTGNALINIGAFEINVRDDAGEEHRLDVKDLTSSLLRWYGAHAVDHRRFVHQPGGHLIVPIDGVLGTRIRHVEITVGFRCWGLDADERLARIPTSARLNGGVRRISDAVGRRIGR